MSRGGSERDALRCLAHRVAGRRETPEIRFVVIGSGRSGSTLLANLLDSHPDIVCAGELLATTPSLPYLRIQTHAQRAARQGAAAFGFKLLSYQVAGLRGRSGFRLLERMVERDWRVIHLVRTDGLRKALSGIHAQRRQFHHWAQDGEWTYQQLHADPAEVLRELQLWDRAVTAERRQLAGVPHLDLTYEDDLEDPASHQATADRVAGLLGVAPAPVTTTLTKLAPRRLEDITDNVTDLRRVLAGTPYAHFLPTE